MSMADLTNQALEGMSQMERKSRDRLPPRSTAAFVAARAD